MRATFFPSNSSATYDRSIHAAQGRLSNGLSPVTLMLAYFDWLVHLSNSPGKQLELSEKALHKALRFNVYAAQSALNPRTPPCIEPLPQDTRFNSPTWQRWPFNLLYQSFLLTQQWCAQRRDRQRAGSHPPQLPTDDTQRGRPLHPPDEWHEIMPTHEGSWWPAWLEEHSSGQ